MATYAAYLNDNQGSVRCDHTGRSERHDEYFSRIFWQTLRVRCQYYRTVVQRPLTAHIDKLESVAGRYFI